MYIYIYVYLCFINKKQPMCGIYGMNTQNYQLFWFFKGQFSVLTQVVEDCKQAASDLHQKARDAALHPEDGVDVLELFQAADRAEQDVQLKTQLVDSLSLASKVEQVTAVQVMWMCKPYLNQG